MYPAFGLSLSPSLPAKHKLSRAGIRHASFYRPHILPPAGVTVDLLNYQEAFSLAGAHTGLNASLPGVCKLACKVEGEEHQLTETHAPGTAQAQSADLSALQGPYSPVLSKRQKAHDRWTDRQILLQVIFWPGGQFPRKGSSPRGSRFSEALI